ncbi:MAG: hypothetical protein ACREH8_16200, partial [Opitutaceae bacterium]
MLKPEKNDRSGIGMHYVDAFLKPIKAGFALPNGVKSSVKRRGLKIRLISVRLRMSCDCEAWRSRSRSF